MIVKAISNLLSALGVMLVGCLSLGLTGCDDGGASGAGGGGEGGPGRVQVVATTAMIGDVVREVGGERVEVKVLIGAGVDPHLYKMTRSDNQVMAAADLIFYNGLMLEGKMTDALVRTATTKPVVAVASGIEESYLLEPAAMAGHYDPHVWMDPRAWAETIDVIATALTAQDPEGQASFAANGAAYREKLVQLDGYARSILSTVPESGRVLVTAHDAFNYFSRAYGFEVRGIQGISTESEAGVRDIEAIVDVIVKRDVKAVFVESTVAERNIRALIAGAREQGQEVVIGGELFSDAMGPSGTYEGTYIGMIDHNATIIARALGGEAPEGGWNGMLGKAVR
ncbi:MAG: zinc ABC transporter substrate-binding protein [Phycisphaerales bacterium]|nr:zinc ABC transporter substrate-binding protein [Phycisphaerales bacterium]